MSYPLAIHAPEAKLRLNRFEVCDSQLFQDSARGDTYDLAIRL
jgi:hypothetical protein